VEGAAPKLHIIAAPMQTCIAMSPPVASLVARVNRRSFDYAALRSG
jgi:hypothetical protein